MHECSFSVNYNNWGREPLWLHNRMCRKLHIFFCGSNKKNWNHICFPFVSIVYRPCRSCWFAVQYKMVWGLTQAEMSSISPTWQADKAPTAALSQTRADSPVSRLVSRPATHGSWVGETGHTRRCVLSVQRYYRPRHTTSNVQFESHFSGQILTSSPFYWRRLQPYIVHWHSHRKRCATSQRCSRIQRRHWAFGHMLVVWACAHADFISAWVNINKWEKWFFSEAFHSFFSPVDWPHRAHLPGS